MGSADEDVDSILADGDSILEDEGSILADDDDSDSGVEDNRFFKFQVRKTLEQEEGISTREGFDVSPFSSRSLYISTHPF